MGKTYIGHPLWSNMDEIKSYQAEPKDRMNGADCEYIITFKERSTADSFVNMMNSNAESIGLQGLIYLNVRKVGWGYHYDIYKIVDTEDLDFDMTGFVSTP